MRHDAGGVEQDDGQVGAGDDRREHGGLPARQEDRCVHQRVDVGDGAEPTDAAEEVEHDGVADKLDAQQPQVHAVQALRRRRVDA